MPRLWAWTLARFYPQGDDLRDSVISLVANARDDQEAAFYQRMLDSFDFSALAALRAKHRKLDASVSKSWFDLSRRLPTAYRFVRRLRLDRSEPLKVLDIACGPSYFGYMCQSYGHEVIGVDKPNPIFEDLGRLLGVTFVAKPVEAGKLLPPTPHVDLITVLRGSFNTREERGLWTLEHWQFFFDDLIRNHMADGGRIHVQMIPQNGWIGLHVNDPRFIKFVESLGGQVADHLITFGMHDDALKAKDAMSRLQDALSELDALGFYYTVKGSK
jgi:hypothetical protein